MSKHWNPRTDGRASPHGRHQRRPRNSRPKSRRGAWPEQVFALALAVFCAVYFAAPEQPTIFDAPPGPAVDARQTPRSPKWSAGEAYAATGPIAVVDGDTFRMGGETIRIADIDTPEMNGRCAEESALARRATARLASLIEGGGVTLAAAGDGRDEDRYGRKLRLVSVGGSNVGDQLVAEGLARPWVGRRLPWCA